MNRNVKSACNPIDFFAHRTRVRIDVDRCHPHAHYALPTEPATGVRGRLCARRPITHCVGRLSDRPLSLGQQIAQVETVPVIELDAFLLRRHSLLLESIAAKMGECVGHLTLRVDGVMPWNIGRRVEVLETYQKARSPWRPAIAARAARDARDQSEEPA